MDKNRVLSEEEKQAYIRRAEETHPDRLIAAMDIKADGEFVDLTYHFVTYERK